MADAPTSNGGLSYMLPLPHGMLPAALPNGFQQTGVSMHISCLHYSSGNGIRTKEVLICS